MTCIATDGKTMAADGLECMGHVVSQTKTPKLFHAKDGSVVGCAGHSAAIALVKEWFKKGENLNKIPAMPEKNADETPFVALILRPSGQIQWMDWHFAPIDQEAPQAEGSGFDFALAALRLGKSPREAVEFAAENIISVGGEIMEMKPKRKSVARGDTR